jgi:hypothetical protein
VRAVSTPSEHEPSASAPRLPPRRVQRGELVSVAGALLLLITMFSLKWYGVDGIPGRSALSTAENAWHGLTVLRWLMLLTIIVTLGSLILHATQSSHGAQTDTGLAITVLGSVTAVVLIDRVLVDLPAPAAVVDQKLGAYLGVLSAITIALGGYDALRADRARMLVEQQSARARAGAAQHVQAR